MALIGTPIKFDGEIIEEDGRFYMLDTKYGPKVEIEKSEDGVPVAIVRYYTPTAADMHPMLSEMNKPCHRCTQSYAKMNKPCLLHNMIHEI